MTPAASSVIVRTRRPPTLAPSSRASALVQQGERPRDRTQQGLHLVTAPLEGGEDVTGAGHGQAHAPITTSGGVAYLAAATDSSVPASFCDNQMGMTEATIRAAATTLTTGAWLGRNRFW